MADQAEKPELQDPDPEDAKFDPALDYDYTPPEKKPEDTLPAAKDDKPPEKQDPPKKHEHSFLTASLARDLGLSQEEIDATPPETLEHTVYHLQRLQRQPQATPDVSPPVSPPVGPPESSAKDGSGDFDLSEDDFDPKLVHHIKTLADQNKAMQEEMAKMREEAQKRADNEFLNEVDSAFTSMADYKHIIGQGSLGNITQQEAVRRKAILNSLDGQGPLSEQINRAVTSLYGGVSSPAPAAKADPTPEQKTRQEKWTNGTLAEPTHRTREEPKGTRRAEAALDRIMRERGSGAPHGGNEEEYLPD